MKTFDITSNKICFTKNMVWVPFCLRAYTARNSWPQQHLQFQGMLEGLLAKK